MTKEMIVSSNGHETMVAILEDDLVAEIFVERERHRGVVGNVYKGRVSKVLPGMQSSFIDLGLERDGFLYVAEVVDTLEEFERLEGGDDEEGKDGSQAEGRSQKTDARSQKDEPKEPQVFINPEVTEESGEKNIHEEGCLSIPEYYEDVERPAKVTIRYLDLDGKQHEIEAEGLLATCIQHEIDHLNGVLFIDHISKLKRDRVIKKFTKAAKLGKPAIKSTAD